MPATDKFEKDEYYFSADGFLIFTEKYHLKRGYCCENACKHCPWQYKKQAKKNKK
jgi:hypothetical protein